MGVTESIHSSFEVFVLYTSKSEHEYIATTKAKNPTLGQLCDLICSNLAKAFSGCLYA